MVRAAPPRAPACWRGCARRRAGTLDRCPIRSRRWSRASSRCCYAANATSSRRCSLAVRRRRRDPAATRTTCSRRRGRTRVRERERAAARRRAARRRLQPGRRVLHRDPRPRADPHRRHGHPPAPERRPRSWRIVGAEGTDVGRGPLQAAPRHRDAARRARLRGHVRGSRIVARTRARSSRSSATKASPAWC